MTELRPLFYWSLIPGLIAVLFAISVKEKVTAARATSLKRPWHELSTPFKHYLLAWGLFSLVNSSDAFLLLKIKQSGVSTTVMILIYCFYNLVYASASPSLGQLSDRIGRKIVLVSGFLVFALVYLGIALAYHPWHYWLLFAIYGLYMAATDGVGKAFAIDLVDPTSKATSIGILGTVTGLTTLLASVIAGLLWDHCGEATPFLIGAVGSTIAAFLLIRVPTSK